MAKRNRGKSQPSRGDPKRRQTDVKDNIKPGGKSGKPTRPNTPKSIQKSKDTPDAAPEINPDVSDWIGTMQQLGYISGNSAVQVIGTRSKPPVNTPPVNTTSDARDKFFDAGQQFNAAALIEGLQQWSEENRGAKGISGPVIHGLLAENQITWDMPRHNIISDTWQWALVDLLAKIKDMLTNKDLSDFAAAASKAKAEEIRVSAGSLYRFAEPHQDCDGRDIVKRIEQIFAVYVADYKLIQAHEDENAGEILLQKCRGLMEKLSELSPNFEAILHPSLDRFSGPLPATPDPGITFWRRRVEHVSNEANGQIKVNLDVHHRILEQHFESVNRGLHSALKEYERHAGGDGLAELIEDVKKSAKSLFAKPTSVQPEQGVLSANDLEDMSLETSLFADLDFGASAFMEAVNFYGVILQSITRADDTRSPRMQGILGAVRRASDQANFHFNCVRRHRIRKAIDASVKFYRFVDANTCDEERFLKRWGGFHRALQDFGGEYAIFPPHPTQLRFVLNDRSRVPINIRDEEDSSSCDNFDGSVQDHPGSDDFARSSTSEQKSFLGRQRLRLGTCHPSAERLPAPSTPQAIQQAQLIQLHQVTQCRATPQPPLASQPKEMEEVLLEENEDTVVTGARNPISLRPSALSSARQGERSATQNGTTWGDRIRGVLKKIVPTQRN